MKIWRLYIGPLVALFCLCQAQAGTSAAQEPVLIPQKGIAAPTQLQSNKAEIVSPALPKAPLPVSPDAAPGIEETLIDSSKAPNVVSDQNSYPLLSKMESITFGKEKADNPIEMRLGDLEQEVFHAKYADQSLFDRTQRLKLTILGPDEVNQDEAFLNSAPLLNAPPLPAPFKQVGPEVTYFELVAKSAENQIPVEGQELPSFALKLINNARAQLRFNPLVMDEIAAKMAETQVIDLTKRKIISHTNEKGENPDIRYTSAGGSGAIMESLIALKPEHVQKNEYTRALVAHAFKLLLERQDDRESLLSPDASGFGFALRLLPEQKRAVVCVEISTNHGAVKPLQIPLKIGDKVDIEGSIAAPYRFAKVTLAWEGLSNDMPIANDETEDALPYFPPLDYVGYAKKSEHDYGTAKTALRMGLLVGILAGGVFMPPVALAAPLVLMAPGGVGEQKPVSDIPMHGGVKIEGNNFSCRTALSNGGKPGIYYVTVWAVSSSGIKLIPVSRRAFVLTEASLDSEAQSESESKKAAKKVAKQEKRDQHKIDKQNKQFNY